MEKIEQLSPMEIEKRSFALITEELRERNITLPAEQEDITKRVIHTTADFDYAETLVYSENAVAKARGLLSDGAVIVTDTNMALSGISKIAMAKLGVTGLCFMADPDVAEKAKQRGVTRAAISMEKAKALDRPTLFAIGNAPTALIRLWELMEESNWRPDFVIGVPVGFVHVEQSKELILQSPVPFIVNRGRKGGSTVAAAICNALLYGLTRP
ncbi:MAG: precorrin-8X methylmutase [Oscillospiraceae bacterium]|nr:precorrin-8X methylmutase [Oscillospiraceae bacterium]